MKELRIGALVAIIATLAVIIAGLVVSTNKAMAQGHDMSKMPGMNMSKPKARRKTASKRRRSATRKRHPAKKHQMSNMPGMNMEKKQTVPSSNTTPIAQPSPQMQMKMPGMQMPTASPNPPDSPQQKMEMNMPMTASPAPSPGASPKREMNMPGMQMPTASPNPQASPQHQMHMPSASPSASPVGQMPGMEMGWTNTMNMDMGPLMVMMGDDMGIRVGSSDTNVMSMGAMGSGTSAQPSSGPVHMYHKEAGDWLLMFHFSFVGALNRQGGPRGVTKAESANWFMPMAYHKLGKGTLQLRSMFSAEPFTFPPGGSPLLFQTGETYKTQPLIDRQHPHDLFMELSAQYTLPLSERGTWFTYFGYPGEPALGPVAFMHRTSASENPSATLAHHLQDSTHISFGVLTTGFTYRWFKVEGSIFNGREPDENRYNFDAHKWNSRSARLWFMPNRNWAIQVSHGFLRSPENQEPNVDVRRTTASLQYSRPFHGGNWSSAFVWGRNHVSGHDQIINLNSYTAESTVQFLYKNYFYTRLELVDKDDLLRPSDRALLGITQDHPSFRIGAYTFGGVRDLWNTDKVSFAVGSDLTFYSEPSILDQIYGSHPVSWKLFFRLRPPKMDMHGTHGNMTNNNPTAPTKP